MPFELGLFLGATKLGSDRHRKKGVLILDREKYRYQTFLSDIAGQDIREHQDDPQVLIGSVRDWLNTRTNNHEVLPGQAALVEKYEQFLKDLPKMLKELELRQTEISFVDWSKLIGIWLETVAKA